MKLKKFKKSILGFCTIGLLSVPFFMSSSFTVSHPNGFIYQGKRYNNENEVLQYLLRNKLISIDEQKVWGDLPNSYAFLEKGQVNKNLLPDYEPSKAKFVYYKASGAGLQQVIMMKP